MHAHQCLPGRAGVGINAFPLMHVCVLTDCVRQWPCRQTAGATRWLKLQSGQLGAGACVGFYMWGQLTIVCLLRPKS